jgi:multidrug efflux pump subunit AcrA (membrane-fusion protein)
VTTPQSESQSMPQPTPQSISETDPDPAFADRALGGAPNPLDNIDHVFRHTARRTWLGVLGLAVLLGAGVLWTAVAEQKVVVDAQAIIAPEEGVFSAGEGVGGLVTEVLVEQGEDVALGQGLARVQTSSGSIVSVRSPVAGRVLSVEVRAGDTNPVGSAMVHIAPPGEQLVIAFYPAGDVSRLEVGQRVAVVVNGVSSDRLGRAVGRVDYIGTTPVATQRVRQVDGEGVLLPLIQRLGPVREVRVVLQSADTASGVAWEGGEGPATPLTTGTLAVAAITVGEQTLLHRAFD